MKRIALDRVQEPISKSLFFHLGLEDARTQQWRGRCKIWTCDSSLTIDKSRYQSSDKQRSWKKQSFEHLPQHNKNTIGKIYRIQIFYLVTRIEQEKWETFCVLFLSFCVPSWMDLPTNTANEPSDPLHPGRHENFLHEIGPKRVNINSYGGALYRLYPSNSITDKTTTTTTTTTNYYT